MVLRGDQTRGTDLVSINRRQFLSATVSVLSITNAFSSWEDSSDSAIKKIKAIAFDAFPIFDLLQVDSFTKSLIPEKGDDVAKLWRAKQFEYCWLRTAGQQYKDFWEITGDALVYATKKAGVNLSPPEKKQLMDQYLTLSPWPDVIPALQEIRRKNIRLSFLSNMTTEMLTSSLKHSKMEEYFDEVISTDLAKTYKPDPNAYQLGIDILKLKKEEILFVAFAGWDMAGAKWFGYPTFWLNRLQLPDEELSAAANGTGKMIGDLLNFLISPIN